MYPTIIIALGAISTVTKLINPTPHDDSVKHYEISVGFYEGNERAAIIADSIKLDRMTPKSLPYQRAALTGVHKWAITELKN